VLLIAAVEMIPQKAAALAVVAVKEVCKNAIISSG
jgi:hypothetical protein